MASITFKNILKIIGKIGLGLLCCITLYLLIGFCLSLITVAEEPDAADDIAIHILTNGVHTDIVMPTRTAEINWDDFLHYEHTKSAKGHYPYVAMGWGDKGFYLETPTWADLRFTTAFKAATGLSTTAIHTTYYRTMNESERCKRIMVSKEQYRRLVAHIKSSFKKNADGKFIHIPTHANYGATDAFYEAIGSYSLFTTCNTWANNSLKIAGQKACLWTAFDTGIFSKYR